MNTHSQFESRLLKKLSVGSYPNQVLMLDIDHDTHLDILTANSGSDMVSIWMGRGNGEFVNKVPSPTMSRQFRIAVGDVDNDGNLDIVGVNPYVGIFLVMGYKNGTFSPQLNLVAEKIPMDIIIADFNQDKKLDIAAVNFDSNTVSILRGYGNGSFASQVSFPVGRLPSSLTTADLNGDTYLDLIVGNLGGREGSISVLLGDGNASFSPQTYFYSGCQPTSMITAYVNADPYLDIVSADMCSHSISVLLGRGNGDFEPVLHSYTGHYTVGIAMVHNDGCLNLLTANRVGSSISLLKGHCNGTFSLKHSYAAGPYPNSIAVAPLDSSESIDFVVSNGAQNGTVSIFFDDWFE